MFSLPSGATFAGDFKVERPLKEGGMGALYVARQISTGRQRALKLMHPDLVASPQMQARFLQEARISGRISSPHVVDVIAAGIDGATRLPWLAMELLRGRDLGQALRERPCFPAAELMAIFTPLCHALGAAHQAGIVHRDLKPENIFLEERGAEPAMLKLLDFGIAKLISESLTPHAQMLGTPLWMAPEQSHSGSAIVPATDVWALGLLAFRLLTGQAYWQAQRAGLSALLGEVLAGPLPPASERAAAQGHADKIPAGFDAWFARCVTRDPRARFRDAAQAHAALGEVLSLPGADAARTAVVQEGHLRLFAGNRFGDYRVLRPLFEDPLGALYVAEGPKGRCWLRLAPPLAAQGADGIARFRAQVTEGAQVRHPALARVLDAGVEEGRDTRTPWIALEAPAAEGGEPLAAVLERRSLSGEEARWICAQVGQALCALHEAGAAHRGLTPHSVVVDASLREVTVLDVGLGRLLAAQAQGGGARGSARTVPEGAMVPLWQWLSLDGGDGRAADLWSLALLVYRALTGHPFWERGPLLRLLGEIARGPTVSASQRAREQGATRQLPPGLDAWFAACLGRGGAVTVRQAVDELDRLLRPGQATQPSPRPGARTVPLLNGPTELGHGPGLLPVLVTAPSSQRLVALSWWVAGGVTLLCLAVLAGLVLQSCRG